MENRIERWWNDVLKWKERFEILLSGSSKKDYLKKEQLSKYKKIASAKINNLSSEEKSSRRLLKKEISDLEKDLYPNRAIRIAKKVAGLLSSLTERLFSRSANPTNLNTENFSSTMKQFGLTENERPKIMNLFEKNTVSQLTAANEILDTSFILSDDGKRLKGLELCLSKKNMEPRRLFLSTTSNLNKSQGLALLQGKPIMIADKWLIPDLNDRDNLGNIRFRELSIPDFSITEVLKNIPGIKISTAELEQKAKALKDGQGVDIYLKTSKDPYQIQASPLDRSIAIFKDGKKIQLTESGQKQQQVKPLSLKNNRGQNQNRKSRSI